MGLSDIKHFRFIESHHDDILRSCGISLVVNLLNNQMSNEEIDTMLVLQARKKTTMYKRSMALSSRANSRPNSRPGSIVIDNENHLNNIRSGINLLSNIENENHISNVRSGVNLLPIPESD